MVMSLPEDKIGQALNIAPLQIDTIVDKNNNVVASDNGSQINDDFEYARGNLISVIEKGQEALTGVLDVAGMSQHPRAYEVAATLIKAMSDANKDLLELQRKRKDLQQSADGAPKTVHNNLFVGSTAELLKALKKQE